VSFVRRLFELAEPTASQVGGKIALRIEEFLETGRIKEAGKQGHPAPLNCFLTTRPQTTLPTTLAIKH
jgi:hypothetical protein